MTDPRVEAAARAIGEYVYERNGTPLQWVDMGENRQEVARCYARVALAAADAVVAGTYPDTITIPEVRNDRPIEAKNILN